MNNITSTKIIKAISESKFAQMCVDKDYAFNIVVEGVKLEVRPRRGMGPYSDGAVAYGNGWSESEYIEFEIY